LHMKEADCPHDNLKFVNLISPRRYLQLQVWERYQIAF
jgi:hypothetical protein